MMQENEILTFILACGVMVFVFVNRTSISTPGKTGLLLWAFVITTLAWLATVLEGYLWPVLLNYLEHICYALSSVLLAVWLIQSLQGKKAAREQ